MVLFCECSRTTEEALRGRFIQNMRGQGYYWTAKDDNGSGKMVYLKNRKWSSLLFYYRPDTCVSLVLLLA